MNPTVLDTSALIAFLGQEPGWEKVRAALADANCLMSAVNLSELVGKASERMDISQDIPRLLADLPVEIVAFDEAQAVEAGRLRPSTRHIGLSLGDRACLALAKLRGATALTADRPWMQLDLGIAVECIRPNS